MPVAPAGRTCWLGLPARRLPNRAGKPLVAARLAWSSLASPDRPPMAPVAAVGPAVTPTASPAVITSAAAMVRVGNDGRPAPRNGAGAGSAAGGRAATGGYWPWWRTAAWREAAWRGAERRSTMSLGPRRERTDVPRVKATRCWATITSWTLWLPSINNRVAELRLK